MRYVFGPYVLDLDRRELSRGAETVPTTPQAFDILDYLIRNRDRVVSKDDLVIAIWHRRAITDAAVTTRLNVVRQAIGDSGEAQRLIRTVPRKGYRFVGTVQEQHDEADAVPTRAAVDRARSSSSPAAKPSIVVIPFVVTSGRTESMALADGIAESIRIELARLRWLDVAAFDREHGVRYILEGSVRETMHGTRVAGLLRDADTGVIIWGRRYDHDLATGGDAGDDIARAAAADVTAAIAGTERRRAMRMGADRLGAWEAYQCGIWHMSNCEAPENARARLFFQRAIELDPTDAAGHSALGWSHMMSASIFSEMTIAEGCAIAEPLLRRAIALDENNVESRARLAIAAMLKGDLEDAFAGAREVLSVDPTCAEALGIMGTTLLYNGCRRDGREAIRQHLRLAPRDPARPIRLSQVAASLYLDGDCAAALVIAKQTIRQYPNHPTAYRWLVAALGQLGRFAEAAAALHQLQTKWPSSFDMYVRTRPAYCSIEHAPLLAGLRKAGWRD